MGFFRSLGVASFIVSHAHAAVLSTGFTVSLTDIDYFLPPKPVASISGYDEIKALFDNGLFVPFTVVKSDSHAVDIASLTTGYFDDDVWQEGFMEGM
jgi:hypothetical protein